METDSLYAMWLFFLRCMQGGFCMGWTIEVFYPSTSLGYARWLFTHVSTSSGFWFARPSTSLGFCIFHQLCWAKTCSSDLIPQDRMLRTDSSRFNEQVLWSSFLASGRPILGLPPVSNSLACAASKPGSGFYRSETGLVRSILDNWKTNAADRRRGAAALARRPLFAYGNFDCFVQVTVVFCFPSPRCRMIETSLSANYNITPNSSWEICQNAIHQGTGFNRKNQFCPVWNPWSIQTKKNIAGIHFSIAATCLHAYSMYQNSSVKKGAPTYTTNNISKIWINNDRAEK
jgi:hypothetical protein